MQTISIDTTHGVVPCSLHPALKPKGLALFGHGLSVDRDHQTVIGPADALLDRGITVLVPELPYHGVRASEDLAWPEFVQQWQNFWAGSGREILIEEWQQILQFSTTEFELPIVYFGLSLGTQYGIPLLASTQDIRASVLGLFGSEPMPKSRVLNYYAPKVTLPVYFIEQLNDEVHPASTAEHLFESLGSANKQLDANPGKHADVPDQSIQDACDFLLKWLQP